MDWMGLLSQVFELCIFPLLGLLTNFLISFLKAKKEEAVTKANNDTFIKYFDMLEKTITECIKATNQTYVDTLKAEGKFDLEAQKIALTMTYQNVFSFLTEDAKKYLNEGIKDLESYVMNKIESKIKE